MLSGKTLIKISVSLLVLSAVLAFLPWSELRASFGRITAGVWLFALAMFLVGHLVGALKWWGVLSALGARLPVAEAVRFYAAGLFANLCLPGIVGGDVVRGTLAARAVRRPEAVVLGSLGDRGIDLMALVVVMMVGAISAGPAAPSAALRVGLAVLVTLLAIGALAGCLVLLYTGSSRLRHPMRRARVALLRLFRSPLVALACFVAAVGIQGGFVLLNAWIGHSIGIEVPLSAWFVSWPLAKLAGLVPISLGGLGVRDAAFGGLLAVFGATAASGVAASLVWQSILIAGGLIAGAAWWTLSRKAEHGAEGPPRWFGRAL